tara:strand:+ start:511 stop:666 length:156 start_codon:yes stop_codon:yes gene_type:complete
MARADDVKVILAKALAMTGDSWSVCCEAEMATPLLRGTRKNGCRLLRIVHE